jgi:hypothetical protein
MPYMYTYNDKKNKERKNDEIDLGMMYMIYSI